MSAQRAVETAPEAVAKILAFGVIAAAFAFLGLIGWALVRVVSFYTTAR